MKLSKRLTALATVTVLTIGSSVYCATAISAADPGTSGDPLVTKSYVDEAISNLLNVLSGGTSGSLSTSQGEAFVPVKVVLGEKVIGGEGAEIILRSGNAVSYTSGEDGIIDVTSGQEFYNNSNLEKNHLLIVPRDDGRGALITSEEAWFIIKGDYTIE